MNKARRAEIAGIIVELSKLQAVLEPINLAYDLQSIGDDIEQVKDDEQEYIDNMPEAMQNGQKGQDAAEAVNELESAYGKVQELCSAFEDFDFNDVIGSLQSALGS